MPECIYRQACARSCSRMAQGPTEVQMNPADWKVWCRMGQPCVTWRTVWFKSPKPLFFTNLHSRSQALCSPAYEWQLLWPHIFLMFRRNLKGRYSKFHPVIVNSAGIRIYLIINYLYTAKIWIWWLWRVMINSDTRLIYSSFISLL